MVKEDYVVVIFVVFEDFKVDGEIQIKDLKNYKIVIDYYHLLNVVAVRMKELNSNVVAHYRIIPIYVINHRELYTDLSSHKVKDILGRLDREKVFVIRVVTQRIGI